MPDRTIAVLHRIGTQVYVGRGQLVNQRAQRIGLGEPRDLVTELEVLEDVLYVGREAVEVGLEVGPKLLLASARFEVTHGKAGGVVKRLVRRLAQGLVLMDYCSLVERDHHVEHGLFGWFEHRVEAAQNCHRQDDVTVLTSHIEVAQDIISNAPDVAGDPVQL